MMKGLTVCSPMSIVFNLSTNFFSDNETFISKKVKYAAVQDLSNTDSHKIFLMRQKQFFFINIFIFK